MDEPAARESRAVCSQSAKKTCGGIFSLPAYVQGRREDMKIRDAELKDAGRILEIYSYYVRKTAISFEYEVPSDEAFRLRMANIMTDYPYLVIEDEGEIKGYAYAGRFHERAAYSRCAELSIYVERNARGKGCGRQLYEALERRLLEMGVLNLYACIADPILEDEYLTCDSEKFHARLGYVKVGEFHRCGYKFGRWYNMIWMEKMFGAHAEGTE